jgi:urea transport system substrate-binding protein
VKVGIQYSPSGTMAISEAPIKEVKLMAIDETAAGGVLPQGGTGHRRPGVGLALFAEKAKSPEDKVATVFGC